MRSYSHLSMSSEASHRASNSLRRAACAFGAGLLICSSAAAPTNLVIEGIPSIPSTLIEQARPYSNFRSASFASWHPERRELLISTRFADAPQLHHLKFPGGARRQMTFSLEPITGGAYQPKSGAFIVYPRDAGGNEFYQLYRFDPRNGNATLLTDGSSRNTGARWSKSGRQLAYSSTKRNGRDTDIYVVDPNHPSSTQLVLPVNSAGWAVEDWAQDDRSLLVSEYISINESHLHLLDLSKQPPALRRISSASDAGPATQKTAYGSARFAPDGKSIIATNDKDAEFLQLVRIDLATGIQRPLLETAKWDVTDFEISKDGKLLAFARNNNGASELYLLDFKSKRPAKIELPESGVITGLEWREQAPELAFTFAGARSPGDVFSYDCRQKKLHRWTESETGGLNPGEFSLPDLITLQSFDGLKISAYCYRPNPKKFPGRRPALILIHGGPEAQSRLTFQARHNYFIDQLGIALIVPNVRGSAGYGKRFLTLDNGFKREDSVRDIGAVIKWIQQDQNLDPGRIAVMGGSYGGYMTLASLIHFGSDLRCGIDVVGISNFLTFLKNTQAYRRDLRRAEYGDERDPEMNRFLARISPMENVSKLTKPLLVVQGLTDPRVPASESVQMVKAIRGQGGAVWYLAASDEGHGFRKKQNIDYQFYATILFLQKFLLGP